MLQDDQNLAALLRPKDSIVDFTNVKSTTLVDKYNRELESLSRELGIDLDAPPEPTMAEPPQSRRPRTPSPPNLPRTPSPPLHGRSMPPLHSHSMPSPHSHSMPARERSAPYYQLNEDMIASDCDEDEKLFLLEKIRALINGLEKTDSTDLTDLPTITLDHSLREVKEVHKLLVQKTDRIRYTELGTELVMGGAKLLGSIFDGNNEFLGYRIDLRGIDTRVDWKLKFIKYEIADAVRSMCAGWHPAVRTGLELATLIAVYSHDTANKMKKDNIYNDLGEASKDMYNNI